MTTITGTSGNDTLSGGAGDDSLVGGAGADALSGGGGNDVLSGGTGNDVVEGGAGADTLSGGDEPGVLPASSTALAMGHGDLSTWSTVNASATYDSNLDAYAINETSANGSHYVHTTVTGLTTGVAQTYSIVIKAGSRSELFLQAITEPSNPNEHYNFVFDLTDGSYQEVIGSYTWASGWSAGTEDLGDGWYQVWISAPPATTDGDLWMTIRGFDNGGVSYTGSTASPAYYVRDFQLEQSVTVPTGITLVPVDDLDMLSYAASAAAVSVDLASGAVSGGDATGDVIDGFSGVIGSAHDDTLAGDAAANVISGGAGNDLISGRGGADTLIGGDGADTFQGTATEFDGDTVSDYGSGDVLHLTDVPSTRSVETSVDSGVTTVTVYEADGSTVATSFTVDGSYYGGSLASDGASGSDLTLLTGASGTAGADLLTGTSGADALVGGAGADTLSGGGGNDVLSGGTGNDVVEGGAGADTLSGGDEADVLPASSTALAMGHGDLSTWSTVNASATYDSNLDAYAINETSANGSHYVHTTVTGLTTGVAQTYSIVVKAGSRSDLFLQAITEPSNPNEHYNFVFDLTDGSYQEVIGSYTWASGWSAGTEDLGDGWYQVWISAPPATTDGDLWMTIRGIDNGSATYTGSTSEPVYYVRDFQLEQSVTVPTGITLVPVDDLDMLSYAASSAAVSVDLASGAVSGGDATGDVIDGFSGVIGSAYDDTLAGDTAANVISGGAGNDLISGRGGADTLLGGDGDDTVVGGNGTDVLSGGTGTDTLDYSGTGSAVAVNLAVGSGTGGDTVSDFENVVGSGFADTVTGDGGANALYGEDGSDILVGAGGGDTLSGGAGADTLSGGNGDDTLVGGAGADALSGGAGTDVVDYSQSGSAVTVDLSTGTGSAGDATGDTLAGVENVVGSGGGDALTGDGGANALYGADGADTLIGGGGADALSGGAGTDTLDYSGSASAVTVDLSTGAGSGGDAAGDTVSGVENLIGSGGGDALTGDGGANALYGAGGADTLIGGGGADTLSGGAGNDLLSGGAGIDRFVFSVGDGDDTILDFDYSTETIDLGGGLGFVDNADLADNLASDGVGGSVITFDTGEIIRLVGVDPANVDVSLFV